MLDKRLYHHLVTWLGQWPAGQPTHVVGSERRLRPGWDGRLYPAIGISTPKRVLLSVPPAHAAAVRELGHLPIEELLTKLPGVIGRDDWRAHRLVFRYTLAPTPLPDVGRWVPATDPDVPPWLPPFGGEVLVARDEAGRHLAGVGVKRHDGHGHELAVVTEPAATGRGLASRLVAQAARRVLDEGAVPTYLHDPENVASARTAEAAGFADQGWFAYVVVDSAGP